MTPEEQAVKRFADKVIDLFILTPISSAFREDAEGPEDEAPPTDPELLLAVKADRFTLMTEVMRLMNAPQKELPL